MKWCNTSREKTPEINCLKGINHFCTIKKTILPQLLQLYFLTTYRAIDESFALCSLLLDCYSRNLATCSQCLWSSFLFHSPTIPPPPRPRPLPPISFRMPLAHNLSLLTGYIITQWFTRYVHDWRLSLLGRVKRKCKSVRRLRHENTRNSPSVW